MIISSLYKTVENNGLLAHIYEHLLAQYVMKALQGRGFFISSDIILTAKTYGDTCFMDVEFYSPEVQDAYNEALRLFDKWNIPRSAALRAATECGIEVNRLVAELAQDELLHELSAVQSSPWRQQSDMTYRKADDKSSVNTLFCMPYIKYGVESKNLFPEYVLEYSVDEKYIQSPVDQALAAVVMQAVALNFLVMIRKKHTVYDRGDQWSEASKSVGYRTFLGISKKDDSIVHQLKNEFMEYVQFLSASPFCGNLQAALVRCSHNYEQVLLGRDTLNSILGGCVVGGRGWLEMADDTRIRKMIDLIDIDIYEVDY